MADVTCEGKTYAMTHKGHLLAILMDHGVGYEDCKSIWDKMRDYCLKAAREDCPDADSAALVFDGIGAILGVEAVSGDEAALEWRGCRMVPMQEGPT